MPKIVFLWTDVALFLLLLAIAGYAWHVRRTPNLRATWARVARDTPAMCAAVVLGVFVAIGVLDSMHYRPLLKSVQVNGEKSARAYAPVTRSVLDALLEKPMAGREKTYSAPLAVRQFTKESMLVNGNPVRDYPRLRHGGAHLTDPDAQWPADVLRRTAAGVVAGALLAGAVALLVAAALAHRGGRSFPAVWHDIVRRRTRVPLGPMLLTFGVIAVLAGAAVSLSTGYHVMGTDSTGNDVLVQTVKSFRTALVIGSLTTLATLPFALSLGIMAGYFKGWVDDVIQYVYTTLTSIPGVLLIAACVLMVQVFIDNNPDLFETGAERADLRLFLLCIILGVTGWAGLCRLLRAETLKLRELDYVLAARALGASDPKIMLRYIWPGVVGNLIVYASLRASSALITESSLAFLGLGAQPPAPSWGQMLSTAMQYWDAWWMSIFPGMAIFLSVLALNFVGDGLRDALDARLAD